MRWSHKTKEELITEIRTLKKELKVLDINNQHSSFSQSSTFELQKAIENLNLFGLVLEVSGKIVYCNPFSLKILEYSAEELIGKNFFEILVPNDEKEKRKTAFKEAMDKGGLFTQQQRSFLTKTQQIRFVELSSNLYNDVIEDIKYLTIIGEDVTEKLKVTEALTRSNGQLQDLVTNTTDLIQLISMSGRFLYVNKAWQENMGYDSDEIGKLKLQDILHPEFAEQAISQFERIKNGEKITDFETVFKRKDGRRLYLSGSVNCRYEKDKPTAFRCIFHNSTAKVRAERASKLYASITQATIRSTNLDDLYHNIHKELGNVIDVKNFFIAQYDPAKSFLYFPYYVDEYYDSKVNFTKRKLGNGLTEYAIAANKPLILHDDEIYQLANENKIYLYGAVPKVMLCVPLRIGDRITGIIGVKSYERQNKYERRDVELLDFISGQVAIAIERKQSEDTLSRRTARLNAIIEGSSHLMWSINRKMQLTSFNKEYKKLIENQLGVLPQLTINTQKLGFKMVTSEDRILLENKYLEAFKGKPQHFEVQLDTRENTPKWIDVFLNPIILKNDIIEEVSGIGRDITELKKYQREIVKAKDEAEHSLKIKERFLANMSHEIRTPMNGVIGMIDLLNDTALNDEQKDYVDTVKKSSETLLHILNDILDLAKIEAGKMTLNEAPVVFKETFNTLKAMFLQVALAKDNILSVEFGENLPDYVIVDETRLLQILSNFTSNALKFTENGTVKIKVNCLEKKGRFNHLKIEIQDSGIGISKENLEILFNAFQQVDNSTKKSFGGTGLGLAISKELCRMMNGEVGVSSEYGKGSTFWFTLKIKETVISPIIESTNKENFNFVNHFIDFQPSILLVDDNATNRKVAGQILSKAGCLITMADSGKKAISLIEEGQLFDLILMDIQMPEMDGVETTQYLKKNFHDIPPILAMTAYAMKEDRERFLNAGMNDYISKPIRAESLIQKIQEWTKKISKKEIATTEKKEIISPEKKDIIELELDSSAQKNTSIDIYTIDYLKGINDLSVLDNEVILQLYESVGNDMDFVKSILEGFEEEAEEQIKLAKEGFQNNNCKQVQSELHTLKGNSGTLGAMRLHEITKIIEEKAKFCNFESFAFEFEILEKEFEVFKIAYKKL
ncbi:MAG: PAS domain S-box protein [Pseudarcicella sp.]|nr:PAS domain S-box protein [Pseudarcicella sp.]MBP6618622.1 PAS domain S-box protein [Leadbetterella sp.]